MSNVLTHTIRTLSALLLLTLTSVGANAMVFTAPPTETAAEGKQLYEPLVRLFSKHTGQPWRFEQAKDWLSYVKFVVGDGADATFSQAHFAGYLALYHNHQIVARAPTDVEWVLVGKAGTDFKLVGRSVCLIPPPEMGNLIFTNQSAFSNPLRAPHVVSMDKWGDMLPALKQDKCTYTVLPANMVARGVEYPVRSISRVPGPTITLGKGVDDKMAEKIKTALLSAEGQAATKALRTKFFDNKEWIAPASTQSYLLASTMLVQGYLIPMQRMDIAFKVVQRRAEQVASANANEQWARGLDPILLPDISAVMQLASNRILRSAVEVQNRQGVGLDKVKQIDKEWSATKELTPFKLSLQESEVGTLLKQSVLLNPQYTELFLTDHLGANVAAYPATSDYWQGDEEKFTKSYVGNGQVFIGKQQFDESTKKVAVQVSVPVYSDDKRPIGVLVAGLVVDYLRWKQKSTIAANKSGLAASAR